jgi:hypothetical protein
MSLLLRGCHQHSHGVPAPVLGEEAGCAADASTFMRRFDADGTLVDQAAQERGRSRHGLNARF